MLCNRNPQSNRNAIVASLADRTAPFLLRNDGWSLARFPVRSKPAIGSFFPIAS